MALGNNTYVHDFHGCDDLYIAAVTKDNNTVGEGYVTGTVYKLAPVGEISKTTEQSSMTKYYDNNPAYTINAEGADTLTLQIPPLSLANLAAILGKSYDATTGTFSDSEGVPSYFALGYRLGLSDGTYRYGWKFKGTFQIPDATSTTRDNGTDTNGQTLIYTSIRTIHTFTKGGASKGIEVDERDNLADVSSFFSTVTTPDTITAKV